MNEIEKKLGLIIKEYLPNFNEKNINQDTKLSELGLDSLDFIELIFDIEEKFNVNITNEQLTNLLTIGDFISFLKSPIAIH